jgi:hypothetical protein
LEAALDTNRAVYYHFEGGMPSEEIINTLKRYANEYGIELVIDVVPLKP